MAAPNPVEVLDDRGSGTPVVYVPGIDGTGELLLGTAEELRATFRLICLRYRPDVLPELGDGYAQLAAGVAACLDACGIEAGLVLAESFGVALALQTALDFPARVRALALVNGFAHFDKRLQLFVSRRFSGLVSRTVFRFARRHLAQPMLFGPGRDPEALKQLCALPGMWFDAAYRRRLELIARVDLRDRLAELRSPVALFASEGDRIVRSVRAAREMAARLPDVTVEVLPGKGHLILPLRELDWVKRLMALEARVDTLAR